MSMLRTGEQTGGLDVTMNKVAQYFEAEANTSLRKLTVMIVPLCVVVAGVVVLMQLASFYGRHFGSMLDQ